MITKLSKRLLPGFYVIILLISFLDAAVYLSMRSIWFFINKALTGATGASLPGAMLFFFLFCVSFLYAFLLLIKCIKGQKIDSGPVKKRHIVLPVFLILIFSVIDIYLYTQLKESQNIVPANLLAALPWFLLFLAILFFFIIFPDLKLSRNKTFRYIAAGISILAILLLLNNAGGVRITSGPVLQMVDDTHLSVVWTTNKNSTGYVEYGSDEKNLKRLVASNNGIVDANTTVHKVIMPLSEQDGLIYRVGSTKINRYFQNNVEYGNTAVSNFKKFKDYRLKDKISFYILNDIHENTDLYKKFLAGNDYDFVVLNGDLINSVDNAKVLEEKILKPLSEYTDGTRPFYLLRGNHETRGAFVRDLPDYFSLPQDSFYYTFRVGPLYAVVLDSAEDKPDSHEEYSGMADFEQYLGTETAWLETLSQRNEAQDAKYRIAFIHIPLNEYDNQENATYLGAYHQKWRGLLNDMGIEAVFSGHSHTHEVIKPDNAAFNYPIFIGGGDSMNEKDFMAIRVEVADESMKIYYVNTAGETVDEYVISNKK